MGVSPLPQLLLCSALLTATTPLGAGPTFNLTFDPTTWTLTWEPSDAVVTSCKVTSPGAGLRRRIMPHSGHCRFHPLELHRGVTLEVNGTVGGAAAHGKLRFLNAGAPGSGAENLTCEIRAARVLRCAWGAGPAAPADVRYSLRVRNASGHEVAHCSAPPGDDVITRCQADDVTQLPDRAYFVVTGSSRSGPVRFLDAMLSTKLIERLSPPGAVSASCNSSHCAVAWAPPPTLADMTAHDFHFEGPDPSSEPQKVLVTGVTAVTFPSPAPRGRHEVRVRAGDVRSERWSDWSPAHEIGPDPAPLPAVLLYALPACAALLCALALGAACRRLLFPAIPGIKDKVSDNERVNQETLRKDLLQP
ncbi:granulocyte-macrophage colony-stimulating factor receptor subunit alpha-like isoform X2 [Arvicanthis niloticus]|uniref:granulocyte-macrophage colony-stimulating factor receptor subunit alpha-like isoform X2 n=1 Tax=Arvicanthis niloticus TaxID=61156 RepID=UPI001486CE0A|nr:granulocyte-macrophage colony-stimulating factor receptor subunit alpha-like isoform X2 [Arvicanthis niloticus]